MYTRVALENIPRWYEISFLGNHGPSILLRIHTEVLGELMEILKNLEYIKTLQEELKLQDFCFDFNQNVGFGAVLVNHGRGTTNRDYDFITLSGLVPKAKKETDNKCDTCNGKGKQGGEKCFFCGGTGKDWKVDYKNTNAIAASFSILLHALDMVQMKTSSKFVQLLSVNTISGDRWGILGGISSDLRLLCKKRSKSLHGVEEAMKKVWEKSFGLSDFEKNDFRAYTEKGMIVFNIPGDACGIGPDRWEDDLGYGFGDHNVDHPVQQLTLLAGLAALHDEVLEK